MYGDDIRKLLEGVASDEVRQTHILMDMINSPVQRGVVLAKGSHTPVETGIISELGIYGVFVRLEATDRVIECVCVCVSKLHLLYRLLISSSPSPQEGRCCANE